MHQKMMYTYVGVDSHKDTHTAVFLDCFFEKLGEIQFHNRPSAFGEFLKSAVNFRAEGTELFFGMEDASSYGRTLAVFLKNNNQNVKHVNALLVSRERKNRNILQKTDSLDAERAARVLLSKLAELPDVTVQDTFWILRTIVVRRDYLVQNNKGLKNHLHSLLTQHYPNYRSFFENIDCDTSLAFFEKYPSPSTLAGTTVEQLTGFLSGASKNRIGMKKAVQILGSLEETTVSWQEIRDLTVQSVIRQLKFNLEEMEKSEVTLEQVLAELGTTLTSMNGIDTVSAAQLLASIGDIRKFATPGKLAQFAGVAPVTYASGKKDRQFANKRGNRELNSLFYNLALRVSMTAGWKRKIVNPFFYEYYHRKISEGKTKPQALKCVQRRLVNIVWTMLTNNEEYVNPPMFHKTVDEE
jgi:transposase